MKERLKEIAERKRGVETLDMSKSLPNPWIRANFIDILKPSTEAAKKKPFKNPAKVSHIGNIDNILIDNKCNIRV